MTSYPIFGEEKQRELTILIITNRVFSVIQSRFLALFFGFFRRARSLQSSRLRKKAKKGKKYCNHRKHSSKLQVIFKAHTLSCETSDGSAGTAVVSDEVTSPTVDTGAVKAGTTGSTFLSSELLTTATKEHEVIKDQECLLI